MYLFKLPNVLVRIALGQPDNTSGEFLALSVRAKKDVLGRGHVLTFVKLVKLVKLFLF